LLEVKLAFPVPYFLKLTMLPTFLPLHQGSLKAGDHWWKPETMVSNGPFRLQTFDTVEKQLVMMRNQHYWQREQMELSQVEVFFSLSVQEVLRRYRAKLLDYTGDVFLPSDAVSKAAQRSDLHFEPWLATMFLRLNCRRPPFNDRRVRQAVRLAIDRQTLVNRAFPPGLVPARSLLPPQLDLDDGAALPFDPQQARALLAAAGYCVDKKSNSCRKLPTVALLHNQEGLEYRQTVQLIVDMLKENLGWPNIELRMVGWDDYLRATQTGDYDLARSSWIADYADPSTFLKLMLGYEGNNRTGWSHEEYNQLIYKSEVERGQSERTTLMNRAQRILAEEAPIVPIHHLVHHYLLQPEVKGFHANPLHQLVLKALQVLPDGQVKP
jgi:oligopeptide transport system substrate-binding protein